MPQNDRVTAFTVSELLSEKQQKRGRGGGGNYPPFRLGLMVAHRNFMKAGSVGVSPIPFLTQRICFLFVIFLFLLKLSESHYQANSSTLLISLRFWITFFKCGSFFVYEYILLQELLEGTSKQFETSSNNFNLKKRCIFLLCFMGNGFQPLITFPKRFILECSTHQFQQFQPAVPNKFIISLINLAFFGIRKNTVGEVCTPTSSDKKRRSF